MVNRYEITLDKQSFVAWFRYNDDIAITFISSIPASGGVWNDVEEDIIISSIKKDGEDATVECLTQYSEWVSTQE